MLLDGSRKLYTWIILHEVQNEEVVALGRRDGKKRNSRSREAYFNRPYNDLRNLSDEVTLGS